ncbi:hypothetical protein GCM10023176_06490 [Micromonospora coerulea]|uniref:LPXTG cell wall anchor domain-containing protein n=1 Tax=Micromonospora coerulea TaxID=47856 RepID=A0ABP8S7E5_9ACTN
MRLSRIIMALTVGLAVAAVPTAAGAAQPQPAPSASTPQPPYTPPGGPSLALDDITIRLGEVFILRGSGFTPGPVRIHVTISAGVPAAAPVQGTARRSDGSTIAMAPVAYQKAAPQPAPRDFEVTADATGSFTVEYKPNRVGTYTFRATDSANQSREVTGYVLPPRKPPHQGGLPVTGSSMSTPMKLGGGLVGAGALMVLLTLAWRRRERFGLGGR